MNALRPLLLLLSLFATGCTAVGYAIGSDADHIELDPPVDVAEVARFDGRPATVLMRDRQKLEGVVRGWQALPDEEYARGYADWLGHYAEFRLPRPGESIRLSIGTTERSGRFLGFRGASIALGDTSVSVSGDTLVAIASLARLTDSAGVPHDLGMLQLAAATGKLPDRAAVALESPNGDRMLLPLEGIVSMEVTAGHGGRALGAVIGGMLDLVGVLVAQALSRW